MRKIYFSLTLSFLALVLSAGSVMAASSVHIHEAFSKTMGNVYLRWNEVPESKYHIYYGPTDNPRAHAVEVMEENMTIGHLSHNTNYKFVVKAISSNGEESWSQTVNVWVGHDDSMGHTTKKNVAVKPYKYQSDDMIAHDTDLKNGDMPNGKAGIEATNVRTVNGPSKNEITLFWNEPSVAGHGNYRIIYTENPHMFPRGQWGVEAPESARSYTIGYLRPGVRYYFKILTDRTESPWISDIAY